MLSATASTDEGHYALLEDRWGTSTVLRTGDYVPGTWAKVRAIEAQHVLVEEEYLDVLGELVVLSYRLELPEPSSR